FGKLPMEFVMEVGESGAKDFVQFSRASLVGRSARLRCVVDEVVGKQFIEHGKITTALHFFGVATNYGFCGLAAAHDALLWVEGFFAGQFRHPLTRRRLLSGRATVVPRQARCRCRRHTRETSRRPSWPSLHGPSRAAIHRPPPST